MKYDVPLSNPIPMDPLFTVSGTYVVAYLIAVLFGYNIHDG